MRIWFGFSSANLLDWLLRQETCLLNGVRRVTPTLVTTAQIMSTNGAPSTGSFASPQGELSEQGMVVPNNQLLGSDFCLLAGAHQTADRNSSPIRRSSYL